MLGRTPHANKLRTILGNQINQNSETDDVEIGRNNIKDVQ